MPIQLVVCDMDGTLFLKDEAMPAFAGEFSRRLAERGIRFAVATGRSLPMARRFVDALKPTAPCVYANGALIRSPERVVEAHRVPLAPLRDTLDEALEMGMSVIVNWDDREDFVLRHTPWTLDQRKRFGVYETAYYPTEDEWRTQGAYKLMVKDPGHRIQQVCDRLERLSDRCAYVQYETGATEIMARGLNKARGVLQLAAALDIPPSDVMAIGDFYNDIEMMSAVGTGVAVGNAIDEVKRHAKYVCQGPYAYGVREIVEKLCAE